jgi:hypothetical protein
MHRTLLSASASAALLAAAAAAGSAGQTALVLCETKGEQSIRQEGIAFVELDPEAPDYGQLLAQIPLPPDFVSHHIFYNPGRDRAYVTSLGRSELRARRHRLPLPHHGRAGARLRRRRGCRLLRGARPLVPHLHGKLGRPRRRRDHRALPEPWPHGITVHDGIDRMLVTSTINPADPSQAGDAIAVIQPSTGEVLSTHRVADGPSPAGTAPVEVFFVPGAEPPLAYITNMVEGRLWIAEWQPEAEEFAFRGVRAGPETS